jgi:hypothetical protein
MMADHPLSQTSCTSCGYVFDTTTGLNTATGPDAGSVSLCIRCGGIDVFEVSPVGALSLRPATDAEKVSMMKNPLIVRARAEIIGRGRG